MRPSCVSARHPTQVCIYKHLKHHEFCRECLFSLCSCARLGFDSETFGTLFSDPSSVPGKPL